jgi:hypothetical protein
VAKQELSVVSGLRVLAVVLDIIAMLLQTTLTPIVYQIHVAERELFVVGAPKELTVVRDIFVISLPTIHMPDVLLNLVEFYYE